MQTANECLIAATARARTIADKADQANQLKDDFLATVSHELRTPLNAVLGWARMVGSHQLPPDREEHAIAAIERSAVVLAKMIDDLLDVSRIIKGTLRLMPQPVDLAGLALAALDVVRPVAATREVQLTLSGSPGQRSVNGDPARLQQVIANLLANAVKFTPAGGRVGVFVDASKYYVEIKVVDTGRGIAPDFLPLVFERFRQADDSTMRHDGLGLGLAIVRQIIELHGGTVHAASEGLGRGATFTVRLPTAAGITRAAPPAERRLASSTTCPMPPLPRLDGLRILVVDGNADGRTLTSLVLSEAGATVTPVSSAQDAMHAFATETPDALVSGIGLPDEDGYGLIRRIRQYEAVHGGHVPAVALTSHARAEDRTRILASGFQIRVLKPADPAELTAAIATVAQRLRIGNSLRPGSHSSASSVTGRSHPQTRSLA